MSSERIPVLAGAGQVLQRVEDPREAAEPLSLMAEALERAGRDSGAPGILGKAEAVYVLRGAWAYGDPGRALAARLGASPRETVGTPYGGNYAQACVIDAAREVAAGKLSVALVTGGETGRSQGRAQRAGLTLEESAAPGEPDRKVDTDKAIFHDAELARGMNSASDIFAIIESAVRFARGESLPEAATRAAELWASLSKVAEGNPDAWIPKRHDARAIRAAGPENPMISSPYTRLMNANARVDMAAGLVVCSEAAAHAAGVPRERLVYLHAAAEANDPLFLSNRFEFHRSPATERAGARALELAGKRIEDIDAFDLYSCFPSSVQVAADALGVPAGRALSVTGGLTFGGGPLNSYSLHAIARMADVLRERPGTTGLVHANGGWLAKHAIGIYATEPPAEGFRYENLQAEIDALPTREALVDFEGPVTVEAYTVAHAKGVPRIAHAACLTASGQRTWATVDAPETLEAMMREEFCGRTGRVDGAGRLAFA